MAKLFTIKNIIIASLLLTSAASYAQWQQSGKIKYSYSANQYANNSLQDLSGFPDSRQQDFSFRYMLDYEHNQHRIVSHIAFNYAQGSQIALQNKLSAIYSATDREKEQLFQLKSRNNYHDNTSSALIDRLYYGYYGESTIIKAGRQTISLGSGLVFQPLDMLSPFSFSQIDQEYKAGSDMLYSQYLDQQGNDYALIWVPRRNISTSEIDSNNSSLLFNSHIYLAGVPMNLLFGQDRGENLFAAGSSLDIADWTFQGEFLLRDYSYSGKKLSWLINSQSSWVWQNHNISFAMEYFYNAVADKNLNALEQINPDLQKLIKNAQLFTLKQNYLALNLRIDLSELSTFTPTLIQNLDDNSLLIVASYQKSLADNSLMLLSIIYSPSDKGSEFGGMLSSGSNRYLAASQTILFELRQYF